MPTELELPALPDPYDTHAPHKKLRHGSDLKYICDLIWNIFRGNHVDQGLADLQQALSDMGLAKFLYELRRAEEGSGLNLNKYYISEEGLAELKNTLATQLTEIREAYNELCGVYGEIKFSVADQKIDALLFVKAPHKAAMACRRIQAAEVIYGILFHQYFAGEMHYAEMTNRILRALDRMDVLDQG